MKYYVGLADDEKTICSVSLEPDYGRIEIDSEKELEDLAFGGYEYIDGELVKNEEKYNEFQLNQLRIQREEECFPVINRGELWYKTLEDSQIEELETWYQAWLNVTETKIVPEKPIWLK